MECVKDGTVTYAKPPVIGDDGDRGLVKVWKSLEQAQANGTGAWRPGYLVALNYVM